MPLAAWTMPSEFPKELSGIFASMTAQQGSGILGAASPPQTLLDTHLACDPSVTVGVTERWGYRSEMAPSTPRWGRMVLVRREGEAKPLAEFGLVQDGPGQWELTHRYVHPAYRRKGLFRAVVTAMEAGFRERAAEGEPQRLHLSTAQPEVFLALLKQGYTPDGPGDERKLQAIFDGDPDLFASYSQKISAIDPHTDEITGYEPETDRGLYVFSRSQVGDASNLSQLQPHNAVRIELHKKFSVGSEGIRRRSEAFRHGIHQLLNPR